MIETSKLDKQRYQYGFVAHYLKSSEVEDGKSYRAGFYQMFWVKSGAVILSIDSLEKEISEGECAFIGPDRVFNLRTESSFEIMLLRFTEDFYCRNEIDVRFLNSCNFFYNNGYILKYKLYPVLAPILEQYYLSLAHICRQPFDDLKNHFAHNTVERLLLFSQKELIDSDYSPVAISRKTDQDLGNKFKQLVKEHSKKEKQVQFYADQLNLSVKRLTDICNNTFGHPPKKIITEQVALEAKRLLQHSSLNIKEVAFELMFQEPTNFIRFFTNATGMTPKEYRDQYMIKNRNAS